MPNYLDVEPDQLRAIAKQHDLAAANIRKWGEIPHEWLADFEPTYGMIADPVRAALVDYYNRRHDTAERLAANHERSRDELIAAARALEIADQSGGHHIGGAGNRFADGAPHGGPAPGAPANHAAPTGGSGYPPPTNGTQPLPGPSTFSPDAADPPVVSGGDVGRADQSLSPSAASVPQAYDTTPTGIGAPGWATSHSLGGSEPGTDDWTVASPGVDGPSDLTGMTGDRESVAGAVSGSSAPPVVDPLPAAAAVHAAGMAMGMPTPLAMGPLASVAHASEDRRGLPSLVVGVQVDEDLALARTLLAGTLAAVNESARGLEWAVAVMRTPVGPLILLTSTEGRGWLPSGLFLPSEVTLPWKWDTALDNAARRATAALESTADPARMLAQFGSVGRLRSARITAMVSSAAISDDLLATLGHDVAVEGGVLPAETAVDFTSPGVGLVDRLTLAGSDELLLQAEAVPPNEIRAKCLELARVADARVRAAAPDKGHDISAYRAARQRIFEAMYAGRSVPAGWWDEILAADSRTAAALRSRQMGVAHAPVGGVHSDVSSAEALRELVFERRANELLLLVAAGEPGRQTLRDALYAYGQITEHPQLPAAARVTAETTGIAVARSHAGVTRDLGTGLPGVSVDPSAPDGAPPPIAELLNGSAGSKGSSEQRSA
ncbi:type VII secretion target [Nocardia sp. CY41]|uniref:type VII secretion target n=1 Tax=Nocardia sp. CY41 TaxID=2608686 RepID=UPI001EEEFEA5|nr:type VII secretion target [Nocardia sp. CY41]